MNHNARSSLLPIMVTNAWIVTWSVQTSRYAICLQRIYAECFHLHVLHQQTNSKNQASLSHDKYVIMVDANKMLSLKTSFPEELVIYFPCSFVWNNKSPTFAYCLVSVFRCSKIKMHFISYFSLVCTLFSFLQDLVSL